MKYYVKNDLSLFDFHDSTFSFVSYDGTDLVVSAAMVNVHKDTPQNPSEYDMEITTALITFHNFNSALYEPGRIWGIDENGESYPVGPQVVFSNQEAIDRILGELKNKLTVYHFEKEDRGYSIGGCGIEPYFEIRFDVDAVTVSWDEYKKKAWYELHRQYRYDTVLQTPNGDELVKLLVSCHEESVYCKGILKQPPSVIVGCTFEGKEYWGYGSDDLWIDAFADLQKRLPEDVTLKCCLTCRYGNFCPVGDNQNEVFCTKDVIVTQKSDLYYYTEDDGERKKRSRKYCDSCDDYQPQVDSFYTYSGYGDYLKKV